MKQEPTSETQKQEVESKLDSVVDKVFAYGASKSKSKAQKPLPTKRDPAKKLKNE